jgi:hypothetical protein
MQPSSSRGFYPGRQSEHVEKRSYQPSGGDKLLPCDFRSGIEIPDDPVRTFDVVDRRIPGVDLDDAHLNKCDHGLD